MRMRNSKFPNLSAEMSRINILPADLAECIKEASLKSTPPTVREKIRDKYPWTDDEMKAIQRKFFQGMSLDYLFYCENDPLVPGQRAV